ncbi:dihydroxyacetone kinase subunit DhaL [Consotaella aegiceratis]|uniref:dihydroxyacetone kinase subunit DhaL n=1 Tax=Consotaella aegiceratis TaxID=3097961 RepID=UPI002F3F5FF7
MLTNGMTAAWLRRCREEFVKNQDRLTGLDQAIGDADHGLNMRRGFDKVVEKLPTVEDKDVGTILKTTGMTLLSSVGGASGPLYGTLFLRAATAAGAKTELSGADLIEVFEKGVAGVVERGKANPGDKTMCDAWWPMLETLKAAVEAGKGEADAVAEMAERGVEAVEATAPMVARKGRASYLGERSAGHVDPGAASTLIIVQSLAETLKSEAA